MNFCEACALHHALPFPNSNTQYAYPLQLIVYDLWGPTFNISRNNYRYYFSFVDAYNRYTWIYFLQSKSDAFLAFRKLKTFIEKQLGQSIISFQADGKSEFKTFIPYLNSHGIEHRLTYPHTSQQNGIFERKHIHIWWKKKHTQWINRLKLL